uniref:Uncharacterized protein n=1 Tax=Romanomermis culicivorax TaxID=13658 RepID=A0A915IRL5_ROMCU
MQISKLKAECHFTRRATPRVITAGPLVQDQAAVASNFQNFWLDFCEDDMGPLIILGLSPANWSDQLQRDAGSVKGHSALSDGIDLVEEDLLPEGGPGM